MRRCGRWACASIGARARPPACVRGRAHDGARCAARAYAPGQFKLLASSDGSNFVEATDWQAPAQAEASFAEVVMLRAPTAVKAVAVAMRSPQPWQYFGISDAAVLAEPAAFMLVGGVSAPAGETCLAARGDTARPEGCLSVIAAGDGREVFTMVPGGQIRSSATGLCLALASGDAARGGRVSMENCRAALDAEDGRSMWRVTAAGQLQLQQLGNLCLDMVASRARVGDCQDDIGPGGARGSVAVVAVPDFDSAASAIARDGAVLLNAALARQRGLLVQLQRAMASLRACKPTLESKAASQGDAARAVSFAALGGRGEGQRAVGGEQSAQAVAEIYAALGADMGGLAEVVAQTLAAIKQARGHLAAAPQR